MLSFRKADLDDAEIIAKNNLLLAEESENYKVDYNTTLKGVKSLIKDESKGFFVIAEENNKIVGHMIVTFEWSDWHNKNTWWLQSVFLDRSCRKKGVFTKMFEHVKNKASEHNVDVIRLYVHNDNTNAIKAYEQINMINKPYKIYQVSLDH